MSQYVINSPLFLNTTTAGVVIPRLTTSQKTSIPSPQGGTLVYDSTLSDFQWFNGTGWISSGYSLTGGNYVNTSTDAFGRLRVSNPTTLFDSVFRYTDNGKWDTVCTGSATGYIDNSSTVPNTYLMLIQGASSSVTRQSFSISPYQPGKSLLALASFVGCNNGNTALGLHKKLDTVIVMMVCFIESKILFPICVYVEMVLIVKLYRSLIGTLIL